MDTQKKNGKKHGLLIFINTALLVYIISIRTLKLSGVIFQKQVNISCILFTMFILELLSTLTFQARMKLTARFEIRPSKTLKYLIPFIAATSGLVAGLQGLLLINDSDTIIKYLVKIPPVFVATFTGVYYNLIYNGKKILHKKS